MIADMASKKRYAEKLELVDRIGLYEVNKVIDKTVDLWPAITQLQLCMYLILAPSPYSEKDFLDYKSRAGGTTPATPAMAGPKF